MFQRIFEYFPNSATVFTGEYLCNCEECLQLHFSSCLKELKEVDMDETEGEENLTINTELGSENDCHIDEDIDQAVRIFEFTDILSYVAVITFSLMEPVYIIEVKEKGRATEPLSYIYGHNIAMWQLYLQGNYFKMLRSKNISTKRFQIISCQVIIPPDQIFETFVEVADDLTMSTKCYLALCESEK